jgi:naphthoate synthase
MREIGDRDYTDILYRRDGDVAWLTINREERGNTFNFHTVREMIDALERARRDPDCRSVVITGAGDRFFCLGGDHEDAHPGDGEPELYHYGTTFPVVDLYDLIDKHSKPVIAMVNGYAVGGGNVLATVCDLTIASSKAVFRQVGPAMGSFDAGFGTAYLEEAVGRKRAKEIWYLNRKYSADEAKALGLVNEVVEPAALRARVVEVCAELSDRGPIALAALKASFHAKHAGVAGISRIALDLLSQQYYRTEESKELGRAFREGTPPDKKRFWR